MSKNYKGLITFWENWDANKGIIFNFCLYITKWHYQDAEDLMSEVMCVALDKTTGDSTYKIKNFRNWALKVARNLYYKKIRDNPLLSSSENWEETLKFSDGVNSPSEDLLQKELMSQIDNSFQKMSHQHSSLAMLYFDGESYEEISNIYGISPFYARAIVKRSRSTLLKELDKYKKGILIVPDIKKDNNFSYLVKVVLKGVHYYHLSSPATPSRLVQKEATIKKYLKEHPNSPTAQPELVENLIAQGKLEEGIKRINGLINGSSIQEEFYELLIRTLFNLERFKEAKKCGELAVHYLPNPPITFYIWKLLAKQQYEKAATILQTQVIENPTDIDCRLLLIFTYERLYKFEELYEQSIILEEQCSGHVDNFPIYLRVRLMYEGMGKIEKVVDLFLQKHPESILGHIYKLHFMVRRGIGLSDSYFSSTYYKLRSSYFWHPDYALIKAMLTGSDSKRDKVLLRRCRDYPDCILSQHYLNQFSSNSCESNRLNFHELRHMHTVNLIYGKES